MMKLAWSLALASAAAAGCKSRPKDMSDLSAASDVPFTNILHNDHDGGLYRNLQRKFDKQGLDFKVNLKNLKVNWPFQDQNPTLLTRFSTPAVVSTNSGATGELGDSWYVYLHEGLDITPSAAKGGEDVKAPVSGKAIVVFDTEEDGAKDNNVSSYETAVAIYDTASHAIVNILHVKPAGNLKADTFTDIKAGDVIGQVADAPGVKGQNSPQHIHLSVVDMDRQVIVNPMMHVPQYNDKVAPTITKAYFTNESGETVDGMVDGSLDFVVEAFDKDQNGKQNFEIAAIDFEIKDSQGKALRSISDCDFGRFTEKNFSDVFDPRDALDLSGSLPQTGSTGTENKAFRYVLTNLEANKNDSGCFLLGDEKGFLVVDEKVPNLKVRVKVYDHMGNATVREFDFKRNQTAI